MRATALLLLGLCALSARRADAWGEVLDATEIVGEGNLFGYDITVIDDLDGDGKNEIVTGSPDAGAGEIHILFFHAANNTVRAITTISDSTGGLTEAGISINTGDNFGSGVTVISDMDGDGIRELAVGMQGSDVGGTLRGAVVILFLNKNNGTVRDATLLASTTGGLTEAGVVLENSAAFGGGVGTLPDVDGDGYDELVVGGNGGFIGVFVLFLHADNATVRAATAINSTSPGLEGAIQTDLMGHNGNGIRAIGDLDGDGISELALGARQDDDLATNAGAVYILFLNANSASVRNATKISGSTGGLSEANVTLVANSRFGMSVAMLPDLDGDGVRELGVGTDKEQVFILFLNAPSGTVREAYELNNSTIPPLALDSGDKFGQGLATLPDTDGDGVDELVCGAYGRNTFNGALLILSLNGTGPDAAPVCVATNTTIDLAVTNDDWVTTQSTQSIECTAVPLALDAGDKQFFLRFDVSAALHEDSIVGSARVKLFDHELLGVAADIVVEAEASVSGADCEGAINRTVLGSGVAFPNVSTGTSADAIYFTGLAPVLTAYLTHVAAQSAAPGVLVLRFTSTDGSAFFGSLDSSKRAQLEIVTTCAVAQTPAPKTASSPNVELGLALGLPLGIAGAVIGLMAIAGAATVIYKRANRIVVQTATGGAKYIPFSAGHSVRSLQDAAAEALGDNVYSLRHVTQSAKLDPAHRMAEARIRPGTILYAETNADYARTRRPRF